MTPNTPLHPDDVTILFLDYDVIIFDDVNPYGIVTSLYPCVPEAELSFSTYLSNGWFKLRSNVPGDNK